MMFKPIAWAIPNRRINPSRALIRGAAELQYKQAAVRPNASLKEHLGEFDSLWGFFDDLWRQELSANELLKLDDLQTQAERDGFRIIRRFALIAQEKGETDFAIACQKLADRIGDDYTFSAAAKLRRRFDQRGIISKTAEFQANKFSARFVWSARIAEDQSSDSELTEMSDEALSMMRRFKESLEEIRKNGESIPWPFQR